MEQLFYSTGQVARQLSITLATVRLLCENGVIAAETTPGGQWRVPASEVERLEREGLPPIPRPLPIESAPPAMNGTAEHHGPSESPPKPSAEVLSAEDLVAITRSLFEKRRIDREIEENEDWFRERARQQAAAEAVERQRTEAKLAEQRRRQWMQQWTQYALNSVPYRARGEVEIEVHAAVDSALSKLPSCEPDTITRPLVDAAVHRALRPWTRKQQIESALNSAMNRLPWDVRNNSECAPLKQRAWDAAIEAVRRLREEASDREMETATVQAVQPMIREYEYQQACKRIVGRIYIFDATREEQEAAKEVVRKALAALPIGAAQKELEKAEETALKPYNAAVAARKEKKRLESEKQARRCAAEWKADQQLDHIARYLEREYEFDGGYIERRREAERLRPLIREALIEELLENPDMTNEEIRESIEDQIDDGL
jgi:excisionase family DNA binding protein